MYLSKPHGYNLTTYSYFFCVSLYKYDDLFANANEIDIVLISLQKGKSIKKICGRLVMLLSLFHC